MAEGLRENPESNHIPCCIMYNATGKEAEGVGLERRKVKGRHHHPWYLRASCVSVSCRPTSHLSHAVNAALLFFRRASPITCPQLSPEEPSAPGASPSSTHRPPGHSQLARGHSIIIRSHGLCHLQPKKGKRNLSVMGGKTTNKSVL